VGELRGRTEFSGGSVRRGPVAFRPRQCRLDLDVQCTDGTRIVGTAYPVAAPHELRAFEQQYAADVEKLAAVTSRPTTQPAGETPARSAADRSAAP
jgi:hypothetical protein